MWGTKVWGYHFVGDPSGGCMALCPEESNVQLMVQSLCQQLMVERAGERSVKRAYTPETR